MRLPVVCSRIIFLRSFFLKGLPGLQPPGSYSIETGDEYYWAFPFSWRKRTRMTIRLHDRSGLQGNLHEFEIASVELIEALHKDKLDFTLHDSSAGPGMGPFANSIRSKH